MRGRDLAWKPGAEEEKLGPGVSHSVTRARLQSESRGSRVSRASFPVVPSLFFRALQLYPRPKTGLSHIEHFIHLHVLFIFIPKTL